MSPSTGPPASFVSLSMSGPIQRCDGGYYHRVQKLSSTGEFLAKWGTGGAAQASLSTLRV